MRRGEIEVSIALSDEEIAAQQIKPCTIERSKALFLEHGFLKVENAFPREFIQNLSKVYLKGLDFTKEGDLGVGAKVSHMRYIVPIELTGAFNDPCLYANSFLIPLLQSFLGPQMILSSLGSVTSLPGAMDQHIHADYLPLFDEDVASNCAVPPFAITMGVPLIDIDVINGPTKAWSGSHKVYPKDRNLGPYPMHLISGSMGSCYFWDYRTLHAGGSNHSDELRPLLYMAYTRPWFHDFLNPDHMLISEQEYQKIPEIHKSLFAKHRALQNLQKHGKTI